MICCVCLNAAIDITYQVDALTPGTSHRVRAVHARAGGKAINVARVLTQLGSPCVVTGFAGGATGASIDDDLAGSAITRRMTQTVAESRRTVTVVADSTTVFNEPGGPVTRAEWARLRDGFAGMCDEFECVVLSGSLPAGAPGTAYADLIEIAHDHAVPVLLDAEGDALRAGLAAGPDLVKPNEIEVADLLGTTVSSAHDAARAGRALVHQGAAIAVISRGAHGLVAVRDDEALWARIPESMTGNPTGAGDALAAVLAQRLTVSEWRDALRSAVSVSAAAVSSPVAGEFDASVAERLLPQVEIEEL